MEGNQLFEIRCPKRKTNKQRRSKLLLPSEQNCNSFHVVMRFPIKVAQMFSFLPIGGIDGPTSKSIRFRWISWKMGYAFVTFVLFVINIGVLFYIILVRGLNMLRLSYLIFHAEALILTVLYGKLAKEWPDFVREWDRVEVSMKHYELPQNLRKTLKVVTSLFLSVAFVEHNMLTYNKLAISFGPGVSAYDVFKEYFTCRSYWDVFAFVDYSVWMGIILQILNWQRTFMWTYTDVFIILMGICISLKLRQIKRRAKNLSQLKIADIRPWRSLREDYVKLTRLLIITNEKLSYIIIVSYSANMYFILIQLFSILSEGIQGYNLIYLWISFGLLIARLTYVCYYGGTPANECLEIVKILNAVKGTNIEINRFITHISTHEMVLTGMNFFKITQNLILKIATALVGYELVMIQMYIHRT
ncbi:gustatory receptor for sugar taste 64e-like [Cylas formicarius]|uniref:gustatory receptor for sugar taste 64e-like n=1 Tax=Cylas formicarius TaxID=197179 RepID=UPI002958B312|nr:gustatory receptor for sugar taste 64e-like [Cylas formicarius]